MAAKKTKSSRSVTQKTTKPGNNAKPETQRLEVIEDIAKKLFTPKGQGKRKPPKLPEAATRYPEREPKPAPKPEEPKLQVSVRTVYYDGQHLPALCFRAADAKKVPCVIGDPVSGIRRIEIDVHAHDKAEPLVYGYGAMAAPYTPERFTLHMKKLAANAPVEAAARSLLLPYAPDFPVGRQSDALAASDTETSEPSTLSAPKKPKSGPARTDGKDLIRALSAELNLPPEKLRAKLRAAGLRAPYTDESAVRKALGGKK